MAPRAAKSKGHKPRGEKKKKEEKSLPVVIDITVHLPNGKQVVLKGISTDRILDVRKLLSVNVHTCHITNYSLSHEVRGNNLRDEVDVTALKPCELALVYEAYDERSAAAHVRCLLDIVACTTAYGPSAERRQWESGAERREEGKGSSAEGETGAEVQLQEVLGQQGEEIVKSGATAAGRGGNHNGSAVEANGISVEGGDGEENGSRRLGKAEGAEVQVQEVKDVVKGTPDATVAMAVAKEAMEKGDMTGMCPRVSSVSNFYDFFSLSHLAAPLQSIRRSSRQALEGDLFSVDVRLGNGKVVGVTACEAGFRATGKPHTVEHCLVDLLCRLSKVFAKVLLQRTKGVFL